MGGRARADELTDVTRLARRGRGGEHGGTKDGRLEALPPEWPKVKLIDVSGNYVPNLDQHLPKWQLTRAAHVFLASAVRASDPFPATSVWALDISVSGNFCATKLSAGKLILD